MVFGMWFESACAMLRLLILSNRASRSHAKTEFYVCVFSTPLFAAASEGIGFTFFVSSGVPGVVAFG